MKSELIDFLEKLNNDVNGTLLGIDIKKYVSKIQEFATIISISKEEEIKAFIAFYENDENKNEAFLTMLAVSKDCWHLGYGKSLLEFSIQELQKKGFKRYKLEVKEVHLNAVKLYVKYEFKSVGIKNGIITMEKKL